MLIKIIKNLNSHSYLLLAFHENKIEENHKAILIMDKF